MNYRLLTEINAGSFRFFFDFVDNMECKRECRRLCRNNNIKLAALMSEQYIGHSIKKHDRINNGI